LRRVYAKYGLWTEPQGELFRRAAGRTHQLLLDLLKEVPQPDDEGEPPAEAGLRFEGEVGGDAPAEARTARGLEALAHGAGPLLWAAGVTVLLTVTSFPLAVLVGLLVAVGRLYGPAPLRGLLLAYVEVLRGTPLLLQLFVIFFVLPLVGIRIDAFWAGVIGLAMNYSAYEAEIYRAGLLAIPPGQTEAALALGLSRRQALWHVVVPQAVRLVVPPVTNDFIALFKDTAVCSVITIVELSKQYSILANNTGAYLELAAATALLYLVMSYPLALLSRRLEKGQAKVHA
jgi:polar amino acid transport system substrate-binding protein